MNERIKQLAEQSNLAITHDGDSYRVINIGEFAELIVQECSFAAFDYVYNRLENRALAASVRYAIEDHFGD